MIIKCTDGTYTHQIKSSIDNTADMIRKACIGVDIDVAHLRLLAHSLDSLNNKNSLRARFPFAALSKGNDTFWRAQVL
ncbi:hypothetical protein D3C71_2159700 [compost metagenome]